MSLSGKYVVLDIGHVECKIMEVNIAGSIVTVFKTAEMRDMSPFITASGTLMNFDGFVHSLKDTLVENGIHTVRLLILASTIGIKTQFEEQSSKQYKDSKELDKHYQETRGRQTSNISISDYQLYGSTPSESDITYRILISTCSQLYMLKDLLSVFQENKFQVCQLQSDATAIPNLAKFYHPTYDQPTLVLIDIGSIIRYYTFKASTLTFENKQPGALCGLANTLAQALGIPVIRAKKLLYSIGILKNEANVSELFSQGLDGNMYFQIVGEEFEKTLTAVSTYVTTVVKDKNCGNAQVRLIGGIMDIPGMAEAFESNWQTIPVKALSIETTLTSKRLQVVNKQNEYITPKFAACLGAAIVNACEKSTNLVPKESMVIDLNNSVGTVMKAIKYMVVILMVLLIGSGIYLGAQIFHYRKVPEYLAQTTSAVTSAKALDTKYKDYLSAIQDIDDVVEPLIEFIAGYPQEDICIASFDTPDMLIPVQLDDAGVPIPEAPVEEVPTVETPTYRFDEEGNALDPMGNPVMDIDGTPLTQEKLAAMSQAPVEEEPVEVKRIKQDIIIRGYATSAAEVTNFYTKLQSQAFVPQLAMAGVKEITLKTEEKLYIFEMKIVRADA
ncbi:MAG: hypothetical protein RSC68_00285 [Acinetobacter sp.]